MWCSAFSRDFCFQGEQLRSQISYTCAQNTAWSTSSYFICIWKCESLWKSLNENESIYLKDILQHFYTFQAIWILLKVKFIFRSQIKKHNFQIFQKLSERQTETEGDKNREKKRERKRMTTADIWGISGYNNFLVFFSENYFINIRKDFTGYFYNTMDITEYKPWITKIKQVFFNLKWIS